MSFGNSSGTLFLVFLSSYPLLSNISEEDIRKVRKIVREKEKDNIITKDWITDVRITKEKVVEFLKENLGMTVRVKGRKEMAD